MYNRVMHYGQYFAAQNPMAQQAAQQQAAQQAVPQAAQPAAQQSFMPVHDYVWGRQGGYGGSTSSLPSFATNHMFSPPTPRYIWGRQGGYGGSDASMPSFNFGGQPGANRPGGNPYVMGRQGGYGGSTLQAPNYMRLLNSQQR